MAELGGGGPDLAALALDCVPHPVWVADAASGRLRAVNAAVTAATGWPAAEALGRRWPELLASDAAGADAGALAALAAAAAAGAPAAAELAVRYDGGRAAARATVALTPRTGGLVVGVHSPGAGAASGAGAAPLPPPSAQAMFLALMSHELRTPLNGMIAVAQLLLEGALTPEQRELTETLAESGDSLLQVLGDVLDFSKLDHRSLRLEAAPLEARAAVEAALEMCTAQARRKGLRLAYFVAPALAARRARGDPVRLRQVVANLVSNAVKFTDAGEVVVSCDVLGEADATFAAAGADLAGGEHAGPAPLDECLLKVTVRDTGIGFSPATAERLFEMFRQGAETMSRRYGGTGLGLAISRRLAELMGGTVWAKSGGEGCGSTFFFTARLRWEAEGEAGAAAPAPGEPPAPGGRTSEPRDAGGQPAGTAVDYRLSSLFGAGAATLGGGAPPLAAVVVRSSRPSDDSVSAFPLAPAPGGDAGGGAPLAGRSVLVDVAHAATARQVAESCAAAGMAPEVRAGASAGPGGGAGGDGPPRHDFLVVDADRGAAALRAGWRGRPVVALGRKEELPLASQPLLCVVPRDPCRHRRLVSALRRAAALHGAGAAPGARLGVPLRGDALSAAQVMGAAAAARAPAGAGRGGAPRASIDNSALEAARWRAAAGGGVRELPLTEAALLQQQAAMAAGASAGWRAARLPPMPPMPPGTSASDRSPSAASTDPAAAAQRASMDSRHSGEPPPPGRRSGDSAGALAGRRSTDSPRSASAAAILQQQQQHQHGGGAADSAPAATAGAPPGAVLRILVAEDNLINQKVVTKVLARVLPAAHVDVVANGLEALAAATRLPGYDLVLLDLHMPLCDGLEAMQRLRRALPPRARPVVVALTADTSAAMVEACRAAGMADFVAKPFRIEDVRRVVRAVLDARGGGDDGDAAAAALAAVAV